MRRRYRPCPAVLFHERQTLHAHRTHVPHAATLGSGARIHHSRNGNSGVRDRAWLSCAKFQTIHGLGRGRIPRAILSRHYLRRVQLRADGWSHMGPVYLLIRLQGID
jgi:hypothetical protein